MLQPYKQLHIRNYNLHCQVMANSTFVLIVPTLVSSVRELNGKDELFSI